MGWCGHPVPGLEINAGRALGEDGCQLRIGAIRKEFESGELSGEETVRTGPFGAMPVLIVSQDQRGRRIRRSRRPTARSIARRWSGIPRRRKN